MVKDHSDSEKGNTLPPHGQLLTCSFKVMCGVAQWGKNFTDEQFVHD